MARFLRRTIVELPPWLILATAWLLVIVFAYPGQLTFDSLGYFVQAHASEYSDVHPPAVAAFWHALEYVVAGPFGMLLVQTTTFLVGLFFVFHAVLSRRAAAWAAAAVFVFPPVMAPMAMIWKDSLMAGCLMLGLGTLLLAEGRARFVGIACLIAAIAFRSMATAAVAPIVIVLFDVGVPGWRRYAAATAIWLGMTVAAWGVNRVLVDHEMSPWTTTVAVHDIAGTLAYLDRDLGDAELRDMLAGTDMLVDTHIHDRMRAIYRPGEYLPIIADPRLSIWTLPIVGFVPAPPAQLEALRRSWWKVVSHHPIGYLEHRVSVFAEVLSNGGAIMGRTNIDKDARLLLGLSVRSSDLQLALVKKLLKLERSTPLFSPFVYFVVACILLGFAVRDRVARLVLATGLGLEVAVFFNATGRDYRYSHWMICCTCVALILVIARRARIGASA